MKDQRDEETKESAFDWFKQAAEENEEAEAQYYVGYCYLEGFGVDKDEEEAAEWFEKAADQGYVTAQVTLGWQYMTGTGVDEDKERAFELFDLAANQNNAQAQFYMGWCYGNGEGIDQDYRMAVQWFKKALENGYEDARTQLEFYATRAEQQDENAQADDDDDVPNSIDECFAKGAEAMSSGKQKLAVACLSRAAEAGHTQAQFYLATFYDSGTGVKQDIQKSLELYTKSAEGGFYMSQFSLGQRYELGMYGVEQNYAEAAKWYEMTVSILPAVKLRLGIAYFHLHKYAEAVKMLESAPDLESNEDALNILVECYENGLGVQQNQEKADYYNSKL